MYPPIVACARQVFLIVCQRDGPDIPCTFRLRLGGCDLKIQLEVARDGVATPDLDIAAKSNRSRCPSEAATRCGRDVVGAEFVGVEGLGDGEGAG